MVEPFVANEEVTRSSRVIRSSIPNHGKSSLVQCGVVAQLGERENGILEAVGSIPSGSTNVLNPIGFGFFASVLRHSAP